MLNNFDEIINRKDTNCEKHDGLKEHFGYSDLEGLWVADMDFKTPDFINNIILESANKSLYGYTFDKDDKVKESIIKWQKNQHSWKGIEKKDIILVNGVVPSYSACIEAFCPNEDDEIIVQTPVYPPLINCIKLNNKKVIINELKNENGFYKMDFNDLKSKISSKTKILCLCSPHNPVGRVWDKEELEELANICIKNNIIIISDEIHSDITYKKFTPLASINEDIANITITLNSAGKTFNIAGLNTSYVISKNSSLLRKFEKTAKKRCITSINFFGYIGTKASYENGEKFVYELKKYLQNNIDFTYNFLKNHTDKISFIKPEATYLLWLSFKQTKLSHKEIKNKLLKEVKIALNDGVTFGSNGEFYFRLNIALPKARLEAILLNLVKFL